MVWRSVRDDPPPRECRRPKLAGSLNHPGTVGDMPPKVVHQVRVFCHTHWQYIDWPPTDKDPQPSLHTMRIQGDFL